MTRPPRTRPRTGTALAVLAWGLAVFSGCLMLAGRPEVNENLWFYFVDVTVAGVYGTVGAVILARRAHPVGWILALTGVGGGLAALGFAGEVWWSAERMGATPAVVDALNSTAWVPGTLALYVVMPWLVRDHPLGRARWGVAVGGLVVLLATLAAMVGSFPGRGLVIVLSIPVGLVAALAVEQRRRSGPVAERNGLGWLALGTLVMALSFVPLFAPASLGVPVWATPVLHLVAQALFPAAVLVAVLRGRMWGLDLVVSRSTVAALMTFGLLGLYLVAVALLERLLPGEGPAHVLAAGIVALAVQPLRLRLERRVHRLVHGDAVDPSRVVLSLIHI